MQALRSVDPHRFNSHQNLILLGLNHSLIKKQVLGRSCLVIDKFGGPGHAIKISDLVYHNRR